eukprot:CAMPEP_0185702444 /NCGR_PEP_ID=MMETSP1164-20130828/12030_1 /TAXON_ID=1104430 /ORGANISM="Chrysoreinhardia sp, Strain CCMP2950" /LENGTH=97 /DNA_ID=CAMNT_0028369653 /DNA_START=157 /DNA_END=446 /DNA_ORIENTATION=+
MRERPGPYPSGRGSEKGGAATARSPRRRGGRAHTSGRPLCVASRIGRPSATRHPHGIAALINRAALGGAPFHQRPSVRPSVRSFGAPAARAAGVGPP